LAYFGFLRVSEFTCQQGRENNTRAICISDVSIVQEDCNKLNIILRFSKTDQVGQTALISITQHSVPDLCPVRALAQFLAIRPSWDGLLFRFFGGDPLTSQRFSRTLRKSVKALGLPPEHFSSHSFRIGAATSAAMCGVSEEQIKNMGRWKSTAYKSYIRPSHVISLV